MLHAAAAPAKHAAAIRADPERAVARRPQHPRAGVLRVFGEARHETAGVERRHRTALRACPDRAGGVLDDRADHVARQAFRRGVHRDALRPQARESTVVSGDPHAALWIFENGDHASRGKSVRRPVSLDASIVDERNDAAPESDPESPLIRRQEHVDRLACKRRRVEALREESRVGANPQPSQPILPHRVGASAEDCEPLAAQIVACRCADPLGGRNPHLSVAPARQTVDVVRWQTLLHPIGGDAALSGCELAAGAVEGPRLDHADAALGSGPDPPLAVFGKRADVVAGQTVGLRPRFNEPGPPAHQARAAHADPHRAVTVFEQRPRMVVGQIFSDGGEAHAVEADDPGPCRDPQVAVAALDQIAQRVVGESIVDVPAIDGVSLGGGRRATSAE